MQRRWMEEIITFTGGFLRCLSSPFQSVQKVCLVMLQKCYNMAAPRWSLLQQCVLRRHKKADEIAKPNFLARQLEVVGLHELHQCLIVVMLPMPQSNSSEKIYDSSWDADWKIWICSLPHENNGLIIWQKCNKKLIIIYFFDNEGYCTTTNEIDEACREAFLIVFCLSNNSHFGALHNGLPFFRMRRGQKEFLTRQHL